MALQPINRGTTPNDKTGDSAYAGAGKINDNFDYHEERINGLVTGEGKGWGTLAEAMAVIPLPNDNTPFYVFDDGGNVPSGNDGTYIYDSGEVGGYLRTGDRIVLTDTVTENSGDALTSGGAFDALGLKADKSDTGDKADLDTSNKSTIVAGVNEVHVDAATAQASADQGISDAATAQSSADQGISDAAAAQDKANSTDSILLKGSDAYAIAKRIEAKTGGETVDLIAYDEKLRESRKMNLVYALYPHSKTDNRIASNINDDAFDMNWDRLALSTYRNRFNLLQSAAIGSPIVEYIYNENDILEPVFRPEPTRTNLVITSAEGVYGGSMPSSETNTISPDGTSNAVIPVPSTEAGRYEIIIAGGRFATGTKLTYSWCRKRISTPTGFLTAGDLNIRTLVNLTELEVDNARQIESDINGYDRFEAVVEIIDGALSSTFRAYYGDVVQVGNSSVAYYGHQLEEGDYATSLINTTGAEVTRLNDKNIFNENLGDKINLKEGVFFLNIAALSDDLTDRWIALYSSDYYFDNQITFRYTTSTNFIQIVSNSNGSQDIVLQATLSNITDFNKIAFRWKKDDWALSVGGAILDTESSSTDFDESSPIDSLALDRGNRTNICFSKIKAIEIYNKGLSNEQLNALTS